MHKRISRAIIHLIWHSLIIAIVLFAITLSLIWLTQSSIDEIRPKIVNWVNTDSDYPLQVEKLSIEWKGIIPHLKFSDIAILARETNETLTQFDSAMLNLDVSQSLLRWKPTIGQMTITGIEINLVHHQGGQIDLLGYSPSDTSGNHALGDWLLEQQHLKLINSRLILHEKSRSLDLQDPFVLSDLSLDILNEKAHHQMIGKAKLDKLSGDINFTITLDGDPQANDWEGVMSINGNKLQITHLLPDDVVQHFPAKFRHFTNENSRISTNIETTWKHAKLATFDGQFNLENQSFGDKIFSSMQARRNTANVWEINLQEMKFIESNGTSAFFSGEIAIAEDSTLRTPIFTADMDQLDIADLLALLPAPLKETVSPYQAEGKLDKFHLSFNATEPSQQIRSQGVFSRLAFSPLSQIAAITNLAGTFEATSNSFNINIDGQGVAVIQDIATGQNNIEQKIFTLDNVSSSFKWKKDKYDWILSITEFLITDHNVKFELTGNIKGMPDHSPELDLHGQFLQANIVELSNMIPDFLLTPSTREWLDMAILEGQLKGGHIVFTGPLDKFPFDDEEGQFEIHLDITGATLNYAEGWPIIEDINTELLIDGRVLTITAPQGRILNATLPETVVSIPDLGIDNRHLLIKGKALGQLSDGLAFIQKSPLQKSIGKKLQYLSLGGAMNLDLNIDIPLYDEESTVKGEVHLQNNQVALQELDIHLKKVNGDFYFSEDQWGGENLSAHLFGDPIKIKVNIKDEGNHSEENTSEIILSSQADKRTIRDRLTRVGIQPDQLKFLDFIHGETDWEAQLLLPATPGDPSEETGLIISSNLQGMSITAPAPLGKKASQQHPLKISTSLTKQTSKNITFEYNDRLKGDISLLTPAEQAKLERLALHFGSGPITLPQIENNIIWVDGNLDYLDISSWSDFITQHFPMEKAATFSPDENNTAFNINIEKLSFAGQTFKNSHFQLDSGADKWEVNIENEKIKGSLLIPYDLSIQPIMGKFNHLKLQTPDNVAMQSVMDLDPAKLPSLRLKADVFELNQLQLGKLQLDATQNLNGSDIENLTLSSPEFQLFASGQWSRDVQAGGKIINPRSKFLIQADGPALGPLLEKFDYGVDGIEGGETAIIIDANWPGSPTDFNLTTAEATLSLEVKNGRFTEIKNRVGKIFGLLSIQSIGRRLSLDFSDLFNKGFTFDKIEGKFEIEQGTAYTNNLSMTGPSAQIDVTGRIDLIAEDYDQLVTVTPSVADSIPMASALFGPVGAGVGAAILLAGKVFTKLPDTIDQVLRAQYTLTGNWNEPILTPLINNKKPNDKTPIHRQK